MKTSEILSKLRRIASKESLSPEERKFVRNRIKDENFSRFFFSNAKGSQWIEELRDFFKSNRPDNPSSGYSYLFQLSEYDYETFVNLVQMIEANLNYYGFSQIIKVATSVQPKDAAKLSPVVEYYLSSGTKKSAGGLSDYLKHIFISGADNDQLWNILNKVLYFLPDPESEDKQEKRKNTPEDSFDYWTTSLEPVTRIDAYEYQQILEHGMRPLCEKDPYQIACILTNATARMIRLRKHREDLDKGGDEDYSEIWCSRLDQSDRNYPDTKERLVHTLTFACEKVYEKSPELIEELDRALRNQRWKIFKRLRQHLYTLNPNEQTLPWIREFILEYKDYDKRTYGYEFQQMIHKACEYFGVSLLNAKERTTIFEAVLSGPSREEPLERMGDQFTEEGFQQWQRSFHRKQLQPFAHLLTGEYQSRFQELEDTEKKPLSDEDYSPAQGGKVSYRSPLLPEELAVLSDEKMLAYINNWQDEHRDEDDWLVEINIGALAGAFRTVFKDTIIPNEKRLTFWIKNRDRIERPIYVRSIVYVIQEHVKEQHYEQLDLWFEFCEWVLSHPDTESDKKDESLKYSVGELPQPDESREHPDWGSSRWAVGDFIGECLKEEMNVPFTARESLANILRLLCTQFDRRLDRDKPVLLNRNDPITEAINSTRSRALEDLVKFGFWVHRHDDRDKVPEVTSIIEERFKDDAEYPFTMPERALLGMYYGQLWRLNQTWVVEHKALFFPQDDLPVWIETFGSFLHFTRPFKPTFEILREDFIFALDHLADLEGMARSDRELTDTLGQHFFIYYLREFYPLNGEDSLLEQFYDKTKNDPHRWASLSNHAGWLLRNSDEPLEQDLIDRIVAFFDWRLEQKEPEELQKIALWLEAECLDPDWRLDAYSKILNVSQPDDWSISIILDMLTGMLESQTAKVIECFAKMTDAIDKDDSIFIDADKAKSILKAGLENEDESVRENAEHARETLLSAGRYSFLDI